MINFVFVMQSLLKDLKNASLLYMTVKMHETCLFRAADKVNGTTEGVYQRSTIWVTFSDQRQFRKVFGM